MFKFEKYVQTQICSNLNLFKLKFVKTRLFSNSNLFKFETVQSLKMFEFYKKENINNKQKSKKIENRLEKTT
jgi:hypothetical protein